MTYEVIRTWAGLTGLAIFFALFVLAVAYAIWPGNKDRFERARHMPLDKDPGESPRSDNNGL